MRFESRRSRRAGSPGVLGRCAGMVVAAPTHDGARRFRSRRTHDPTPQPLLDPEDVVLSSRPMIDHISLRVQDFPRAIDFYRSALAPLGYKVLMEFPNAAGLGANGKADLWIM